MGARSLDRLGKMSGKRSVVCIINLQPRRVRIALNIQKSSYFIVNLLHLACVPDHLKRKVSSYLIFRFKWSGTQANCRPTTKEDKNKYMARKTPGKTSLKHCR